MSTTDYTPDAEHLEALTTKGYLVLPNVLSKTECYAYKKRLNTDYARYHTHYASSPDTEHQLNNKRHEKVVYNMHNKSMAYYPLFDHPCVWPLIQYSLQQGSYQNAEACHLLNISARNPLAGAPAQQLHLDSNLPGSTGFPLIMVALFMLDDFNPTNGSTRVVPKSHLRTTYAATGHSYPDEVIIEAPQGSVLIFNGALWHGGTAKNTTSERWGVLLGYGRWFIKPSFDFQRNIPIDIRHKMPARYQALFGLHTIPPLDEFTRITRRSLTPEPNHPYTLPSLP